MTISRVELQGQIMHAQDYTNIKHHEDHHSTVVQGQLTDINDKAAELKLHQVNDPEQAENRRGNFDAKDEGSNQYAGDGGAKRHKKEESDGKVILKAPEHGFDLKI
ncbi:MAG: hypothetical protein K5888_05585 [Lachnospiraceae bacterium]|nr:hypothetical protein [Lachnospiraceae bacterium]